MKLGVGLYHYMLGGGGFTLARQRGYPNVIIHLANYYGGENDIVEITDEEENYGITRAEGFVWSLDHMMTLQKQAKEKGLNIYGIENSSPTDWYDMLLDGPRKEEQMEHLKETIYNVGKVDI